MKTLPLLALVLPALLAATLPAHAEVKLSKVFTPHMVLQRGMAVPIWGTAAPEEKVEVKFRDQTKSTKADKDGKWSVKLDALKAGGPDVLTIGDKKIDDVLVGDVWVGSGQSNMGMAVGGASKNDPVLAKMAAETFPKVRLLRQEANAVWQEGVPANLPSFSALLFSFGVSLQKELDVPVGLMAGAVGGTPSGYWLSETMLAADPAVAAAAQKFAVTYDFAVATSTYEKLKAKYDEEMVTWQPLADAAKKEGKPAPLAPRAPEPATQPGEIRTGKVGQLFEAYIRPYVGYAIKGVLWDQGEAGTRITGVDQYTVMGALIKGWRRDWGQGDFPFIYIEKPSGGGCAWDYNDPVTSQGDKFSPLPAAIPLLLPAEYTHQNYRRLMEFPQTYMATSTDLGGMTHPVNKSGYGARAACVAFGAVYGKKVEWLGPVYASHQVEGDKVIVKFTHTGKGLAFKNGEKLQGFLIAGDDKKFAWADATIAGETVVVSSAAVPQPAAVRYAWSAQFPWANLFNQDGLPALPFRTDDW